MPLGVNNMGWSGPPAKKKTKNTTERIYYSGANVKVYFGDVWVEELASIQYQVEENVAPIYGFNSYMFDKVARGTRLVTGSFMLNHTESGYLNIILDRISETADLAKGRTQEASEIQYLKDDVKHNNSLQNIQNLLSVHGDKKYSDYVKGLKESYWGTSESSGTTTHRTSEGREYQPNYYADKEGSGEDNPLKQHGFNILLDMSPSANTKDFIDCIRDSGGNAGNSQTYRSIIGVHITGENQMIAPDGSPLQTQYNFIARDIDGDVTELSMRHNQLYKEKRKQIMQEKASSEEAREKRRKEKEQKKTDGNNTRLDS